MLKQLKRLLPTPPKTGEPSMVFQNKSIPGSDSDLSVLSPWQQAFCRWNAERLDLTVEQSEQRYRDSWFALEGGHSGPLFRDFNVHSHNIYKVFWDDRPEELYESYQFHSHMHMLRMLSYPVPEWKDNHPVLQALGEHSKITILDFGCGLAQPSISLAECLRGKGVEVHVVLADLPTIRFDFLEWFCRSKDLSFALLPCTKEQPLPELPNFDILIIRDVWEHLYDPIHYMNVFNRHMNPGGIMMSNTNDHRAEFMHVSPNLQALRAHIENLGYQTVLENKIVQKPWAEAAVRA